MSESNLVVLDLEEVKKIFLKLLGRLGQATQAIHEAINETLDEIADEKGVTKELHDCITRQTQTIKEGEK